MNDDQGKNNKPYSQPEVPMELRTGDFLASMSDETFRVSDENLVYGKSFFAFLDILGYKALIEKHGAEAPKFIFKIVANAYQFHRSSYESVKVKVLSDSILIWSTIDHPIGFWNVLNVTDMLRGSFLKEGLLIRGGLSFGDNFIHSDIIISPALISSYQLEQQAVYPRIIIDDSALKEGQQGIIKKEDGKLGMLVDGYFRICEFDHIRKDKDGHHVISPFFGKSGVYCLKHGLPGWYNKGDRYPTEEQIRETKKVAYKHCLR